MPLSTRGVVAAAEVFTCTAQPTVLTGDGLTMRPWEPSDAPAVFDAFTDPSICRWHVRTASSVDEVGGWIASCIADWATGLQAHWCVADVDTGAVVGRVALKNINVAAGQAEMAYWTMPAVRGRAVAPRAVRALSVWAFGETRFHRLELTHSVHNAPSCRVAAKTGYALDGTKRSAGLHRDRWHDMHLHARIMSR